MKIMPDRRLMLITLGACLLAMPLGCGGDEGGATPDDVIKTAQKAFAAKDYETFVGCVAPDERPLLSTAMLLGATMMVNMPKAFGGAGDPKNQEELKSLLEKHGVQEIALSELPRGKGSSEQALKKLADEKMKDVDHAAFLADMMTFMDRLDKSGKSSTKMNLKGKLEDLQIDGDAASGRVGQKPVSFVRIDGRWYMKMSS